MLIVRGHAGEQDRIITLLEACNPLDVETQAAIDLGVPTYRFVRRYVERRITPQLALRQVDPLIRELTQYRDLINHMTKESE